MITCNVNLHSLQKDRIGNYVDSIGVHEFQELPRAGDYLELNGGIFQAIYVMHSLSDKEITLGISTAALPMRHT